MDQNTVTETTTKSIRDNDVVTVKSLVPNVYYTCSKTLDSFIWAEAGNTEPMTFAQLKVMKTKHPDYFKNKWLYPQSEAALKKLGIDGIFAGKFDRKDMQLLYGNDVDAVKEKISFISSGEKDEFVNKVKKAVKQGKIVNIKIIRLLEKELEVELMDLV